MTKGLVSKDRSPSPFIIKYSSMLPKSICNSLSSFVNEKQRAIIIILDMEGKASFSQLQRLLRLKKNDLSYQLNCLELNGLIKNELKKERGLRDFSWYSLTTYGDTLFSTLLDVYVKSISPDRSIFERSPVTIDVFSNEISPPKLNEKRKTDMLNINSFTSDKSGEIQVISKNSSNNKNIDYEKEKGPISRRNILDYVEDITVSN